MELTRETLLERKAALLADYHVLSGALQQVDWSLDQLDITEDTSDVAETTDLIGNEEDENGDCNEGPV